MASTSTEEVTGVLLKAEETSGILTPSEVGLLVKYICDLEDDVAKLSARVSSLEDELQSAEGELEERPARSRPYGYDDL